ncbi:signal peptidase complex subunit 3-like [Uranotaenia lowii]|uniref:signal peptidase complex subunit 3-like n=1 Tax=Uranotaenia lowii TaxID=190385 RepID=UPI002479A713|nr:signal peptidase complex subunit 3-like [Uranotaenia lowii]
MEKNVIDLKQLFMYLTAESQTEQKELNQVVLWDKIILRGENALLNFKNMITRYYFWDDAMVLRNHQNVTTTLSWNIVPNAGLLPNVFAHGHHSFKFSETYMPSPAGALPGEAMLDRKRRTEPHNLTIIICQLKLAIRNDAMMRS